MTEEKTPNTLEPVSSSKNTDVVVHRKGIRSFVLRQGRMTKAQEVAFEKMWPLAGLDYQETEIDLAKAFDNDNEQFIVEIGFGNGKSLAEMAASSPNINYLGIEVHTPGVGSLLMEVEQLKLNNLKCIRHDAIEVLENMLPKNSLNGVQLFFPDPWPKKKHHKRRIVKPEFLDLILRCLKQGGRFHMATDWWPYAEDAMEVITAYTSFENESGSGKFSQRPEFRPRTKFEARGENLGHGVWDLMFKKITKTS